jgi:hypothetical protein
VLEGVYGHEFRIDVVFARSSVGGMIARNDPGGPLIDHCETFCKFDYLLSVDWTFGLDRRRMKVDTIST